MASVPDISQSNITFKDVAQLIVGTCVLGIPLAYTEETWVLGEQLPLGNVLIIATLSLCFLAFFSYFMFFECRLTGRVGQFIIRVFAGYFITLVIIGVILTTLQKCPWLGEPVLALKRVIVVAFPACFSATIIDSLR